MPKISGSEVGPYAVEITVSNGQEEIFVLSGQVTRPESVLLGRLLP